MKTEQNLEVMFRNGSQNFIIISLSFPMFVIYIYIYTHNFQYCLRIAYCVNIFSTYYFRDTNYKKNGGIYVNIYGISPNLYSCYISYRTWFTCHSYEIPQRSGNVRKMMSKFCDSKEILKARSDWIKIFQHVHDFLCSSCWTSGWLHRRSLMFSHIHRFQRVLCLIKSHVKLINGQHSDNCKPEMRVNMVTPARVNIVTYKSVRTFIVDRYSWPWWIQWRIRIFWM
jgi:hypothetical protein